MTTKKVLVQQLHKNPDCKYAVFLRSPSGNSAKFKYLFDDLEEAIERCRQFAATAASHGHIDYTYYAVEIKHRVGIEQGSIVDKAV